MSIVLAAEPKPPVSVAGCLVGAIRKLCKLPSFNRLHKLRYCASHPKLLDFYRRTAIFITVCGLAIASVLQQGSKIMSRTSWKCLLVGVVVAIALSSLAPQADAQWWGCCRSAGWGCCYTPCCSSCWGCGSGCYDGGWYLGCRPGPVRRLLFGPCRWYWGGCGYGCGYSYGCGYGGCSYGGCTTYDGCCLGAVSGTPTPAQPTPAPTPAKKPVLEPPPAMPTEPAPSPTLPGPGGLPGTQLPGTPPGPSPVLPKTSATSADASGILTVWVPYDAKVTING